MSKADQCGSAQYVMTRVTTEGQVRVDLIVTYPLWSYREGMALSKKDNES